LLQPLHQESWPEWADVYEVPSRTGQHPDFYQVGHQPEWVDLLLTKDNACLISVGRRQRPGFLHLHFLVAAERLAFSRLGA
jgi:hypothetical protein